MFRLSPAGSVSRAVNNLQMDLQKKRVVAVHCTRICKMESHAVSSKSTAMVFLPGPSTAMVCRPHFASAQCRARHPNHCAPLPAPAAGSPCHRYRCHRGVDGERALELIQGPEVPQPPPSIQGEQGVEGAGP